MAESIREIAKAVAITEISGIGDARALKLIDHFGSPAEVFEAPIDDLIKFHFVDSDSYEHLQQLTSRVADLEAEFTELQTRGIEFIPAFGDRYPERLSDVSGPLVLYARGNTDLLTETDAVGYTGTRSASEDAIRWTRQCAESLASEGRVIISGGATGVDTAAHRGALNADGQTIVVLGTGITVAYPEKNADLFDEIVEKGGLILSQRLPTAGPSRAGFLNRNATLTGLSQSVVVVATDGSGGTMSTYSDAVSQDKLVFCPDPELELEPVAGITQISNDEATPVRTPEEILAYQESERDKSDISSRDSSGPDETDQTSVDDFV